MTKPGDIQPFLRYLLNLTDPLTKRAQNTVSNGFLGFRGAPLTVALDPQYLYFSERYTDALAHLLYGVTWQGGAEVKIRWSLLTGFESFFKN